MWIFEVSLCIFPAKFPVGKVVSVMKTLPCKRRLQSVLLNIDLKFQAAAAFIFSAPLGTPGRCVVYLHKARQRYCLLPSWYARKGKWICQQRGVRCLLSNTFSSCLSYWRVFLSLVKCQCAAVTLADQLHKSPVYWLGGRKEHIFFFTLIWCLTESGLLVVF